MTRLINLMIIWNTTLLAGALSSSSFCQEQDREQYLHYISDKILVPVRSGAGGDFRILNRGIPSGTPLKIIGSNESGRWTEIQTEGGTQGWIPTQFVQEEAPAKFQIDDLRTQLKRTEIERDRISLLIKGNGDSESNLDLNEILARLEKTQLELANIKRVSSAAIELDMVNQDLIAELEAERSDGELLRLEIVRLRERVTNNQLLDGALAVLLGVIIAIFISRLWPKRPHQGGWS